MIDPEMRDKDRKKLWGLAGGRCSRCRVFHNEVRLTEAHIVAPEPSGPRGGDSLPLDQREAYENYILLCPNCHYTVVDACVEDWPVERLRQLKAEHEDYIRSLSQPVTELDGTVNVSAPGGDDVAGLRTRKTARIKPGFNVNVDAPGSRRVTGVEIGDSSD